MVSLYMFFLGEVKLPRNFTINQFLKPYFCDISSNFSLIDLKLCQNA
jgi:hypothetical protein